MGRRETHGKYNRNKGAQGKHYERTLSLDGLLSGAGEKSAPLVTLTVRGLTKRFGGLVAVTDIAHKAIDGYSPLCRGVCNTAYRLAVKALDIKSALARDYDIGVLYDMVKIQCIKHRFNTRPYSDIAKR